MTDQRPPKRHFKINASTDRGEELSIVHDGESLHLVVKFGGSLIDAKLTRTDLDKLPDLPPGFAPAVVSQIISTLTGGAVNAWVEPAEDGEEEDDDPEGSVQ